MFRSLTLAAVATMVLLPELAEAGKKSKPKIQMAQVLDALNLLPNPKKIEESFNRLKSKPLLKDMTCSQAIDHLDMKLKADDGMSSIFYLLLNGWYLGNWGDYGSCLADTSDGQFIMATVHGNYDQKNKPLFTRGAYGKYSEFTTRLGLCMPKTCTEADLQAMSHKYTKMAEKANWTDTTVTYRFSSRDDEIMMSQPASAGLSIVLVAIIILMVLGIAGTCIELTKIGDIDDLNYKRLEPVAQFVSIK